MNHLKTYGHFFFHLSLLNIGDLFYKKIAIISIKKIRGMLFTIKITLSKYFVKVIV